MKSGASSRFWPAGRIQAHDEMILIADDNLGGLLKKMASYEAHTPIFQMKADDL